MLGESAFWHVPYVIEDPKCGASRPADWRLALARGTIMDDVKCMNTRWTCCCGR